jgi:hypothetical protein
LTNILFYIDNDLIPRCESLFIGNGKHEYNRIFQIPYVIDAAGVVPGIRAKPARIQSDSREVMVMPFHDSSSLFEILCIA